VLKRTRRKHLGRARGNWCEKPGGEADDYLRSRKNLLYEKRSSLKGTKRERALRVSSDVVGPHDQKLRLRRTALTDPFWEKPMVGPLSSSRRQVNLIRTLAPQ